MLVTFIITIKIRSMFNRMGGPITLENQHKTRSPILAIYLCIHGKCNPWDYVTMTRDVRLFKV